MPLSVSSSTSRSQRAQLTETNNIENKDRITRTSKKKRRRHGESSRKKVKKRPKICININNADELSGFDPCGDLLAGAIKTPKSKPSPLPQLSDDEYSDIFGLSTSSIFKQRSFYRPPTPKRTDKCKQQSIFSFSEETVHKLTKNRKSYDLNEDIKQIKREIERDQISKVEEMRFLEQRQIEINQSIFSMFDEPEPPSIGESKQRITESLVGKDKFSLPIEISKNVTNEWKVCVHELKLDKMHKNNLIVGIQMMDDKGKTNCIYTNEKGKVYKNKKMIKKGLRIKPKSEMILSVFHQKNKEEIVVNFAYFCKKGTLLRSDSKPIKIRHFKQQICEAKIFIAQNVGGYGMYSISKV